MKMFPIVPLIVSLFLFTQCEKERPLEVRPYDPSTHIIYPIDKGVSIKSSFSGKIINEAGTPVGGASVTVGDKTTQTNADGLFYVTDAKVYENHAYIKVDAANYFHGSRSLIPKQGVNQVNITLLSGVAQHAFASNTGGVVSVGKTRIEFGTGYTDVAGKPYTGTVKVAVKYLDPEADNLNEIMPGDLIASSSEGTKLLESFGMVAVELSSSNGSKLQLASGNEATLKMGLSPAALSKAPAEIPLWYFNETLGHWVEEGLAQLIDGEYVGKVKHFSFWNCDRPRDYNRIDGVVKTSDGSPLGGVDIHLTSSMMGTGHCMTSSDGGFGGRVPSGETFLLKVSYYNSGVLQTIDLGPYTSDAVLSDIIIGDVSGLVTLSGKYNVCNNSPMLSGMLFLNDQSVIYVKNGSYSFKYPANRPFTLRAYDQNNLTTRKSFVGFSSNTELPPDSLCKQNGGGGLKPLSYQVSFELDGITTTYKNGATSLGYSATTSFVKLFVYETPSPHPGTFKLEIQNYSGPRTYTIRNGNKDLLRIGNYAAPHCTYADSVNVRVKDYFIISDNVAMDIEFSGTVNVWNNQLQAYEKKVLRNGSIVAMK